MKNKGNLSSFITNSLKIGDKELNEFEKQRLKAYIESMLHVYRKSGRQDIRESVIDNLHTLVKNNNLVVCREVVAEFIKTDMASLSKEVERLNEELSKAKPQEKFIIQQKSVMKAVETRIETLSRIIMKLLENGTITDRAAGEKLLQGLVKAAGKDAWGREISSEIVSHLSQFVPKGEIHVVAALLNQLNLEDVPLAKLKRILLSAHASDEEIIEILRQLNPLEHKRIAYLVVLRHCEKLELLEKVVNDKSIDMRYRLYAFTQAGAYLSKNKENYRGRSAHDAVISMSQVLEEDDALIRSFLSDKIDNDDGRPIPLLITSGCRTKKRKCIFPRYS